MALPATRFHAESSMEARIASLETHTEHIQSYVQDLRQDMRGLRQEMKELSTKFDTKWDEINKKFDTKFGEVHEALESMRLGRVWDRVWMLLAMGALLGVMARGFKWI